MRRSKHNLSHYKLLTGDMGYLYPVAAMEVLPGDTFRHSTQTVIRMQPLLTPLLHPVHVRLHHWYIPNRLIWDGWEKFITGQEEGQHPSIDSPQEGDTLLDYMGVPPTPTNPFQVNALPLRAYNKVWNEFFRDQDIDTERTEDQTDIPFVRWEKDYFTTARQYAQSGQLSEAASIIFAQDVPVSGIGLFNLAAFTAGQSSKVTGGGTENWTGTNVTSSGTAVDNKIHIEEDQANPGYPNVRLPAGSVAGTMDINEWRRAMAAQKYREHRNRFGSRYTDYLRYLGIKPSDSRLDRPEYLGGGKQLVSFSEVLQTVDDTTNNIPLGYQGGHGIASARTGSYRRFFEEHGWVISTLSVRPRSMYSQATKRSFIRSTKEDYWQLENEALGEQPVLTRELYGDTSANTNVFGYVPRHSDYRQEPSTVSAGMRKTEYNMWHMSREFTADPQLNPAFLECDPTKRIWRSQNDPQMYILSQHRIAARRLVRKFARTF